MLAAGYQEINSRAFYHISFQIQEQDFSMILGIQNPQKTLKIATELKSKGLEPRISRIISYNSERFFVKEPETENLTLQKLEEIVATGNEALPVYKMPLVTPDRRGIDVGD